jgi:hypothetical protein
MRSSPTAPAQLILFPGAPAQGPGPVRARRAGPAARKAEQLDRIAEAAERELADAWRAGDMVAARSAHDRARGARRAAQILRAGPSGVAEVIGGRHEAA